MSEHTVKADVFNMYRLLGSDPAVWYEQSQGLLHCAEVLRDHLFASLNIPAGARRVQTNGLVDSIMLLLGLSIENGVKGAYIAQHPELVSTERLDRSTWNGDSGHAVRQIADQLISLTASEADLLDRLQEHVVWAGKYPIPTKASRYYGSRDPVNKRSLRQSDFDLASSLLERLQRAQVAPEPGPAPA